MRCGRRASLPRSPRAVIVFGGFHGDEPKSVTLSRCLIDYLESIGHHRGDVQWLIDPLVNPDGYERRKRRNANRVDINRNFPTLDWKSDPVEHRSTLDDPRDVKLSPGSGPGSEPETRALVELIEELKPETVVALHAPLACIDDAKQGPLAHWIAERTGLPLVADVGYPTPGSFGTWGGEHDIGVVTYEFPLSTTDALVREHVPVLVELLASEAQWS